MASRDGPHDLVERALVRVALEEQPATVAPAPGEVPVTPTVSRAGDSARRSRGIAAEPVEQALVIVRKDRPAFGFPLREGEQDLPRVDAVEWRHGLRLAGWVGHRQECTFALDVMGEAGDVRDGRHWLK